MRTRVFKLVDQGRIRIVEPIGSTASGGSFSGFAIVRTLRNPTSDPPHCKSSRDVKEHLDLVKRATSVLHPNFRTLNRRHQVEPYLSRILVNQTTSEGRTMAYRRITGIMEEALNLTDEIAKVVW